MRYHELFNVIKTVEVDDFGFTRNVGEFKIQVYSHKKQFNIIRDNVPTVILTNYNDDEVKIYIARDGCVDYNNPDRIVSLTDDVEQPISFIVFIIDILS